jgi:hypothetical protein
MRWASLLSAVPVLRVVLRRSGSEKQAIQNGDLGCLFTLSAGVQKETSARIQKETDLEGIFSEDFRPGVEGWFWRLSNGPEVTPGVMDNGNGGFFGGSNVPALAEKVDLVVGVDAAFQMEGQMEVQQGGWWTGTRGDAFVPSGFFPRSIGAEPCGAADGGVLALQLPVKHGPPIVGLAISLGRRGASSRSTTCWVAGLLWRSAQKMF